MSRLHRKTLRPCSKFAPLVFLASFASALAANQAIAQAVDGTVVAQRLDQVNVVGAQPLPGLDLPRERVSANVQTVDKAAIERGRGQSLVELINTTLPSVNLNSVLGNAV